MKLRFSKICVVTTTRADFGLLNNLIKKLSKEDSFNVSLLVSGTHLLREFGYTFSEIEESGCDCKIIKLPIMKKTDEMFQIMAKTISVFGKHFKNNKYDCVIVLGDRFEILGVAEACLFENIPLVHVSGGDITFGAIDDCCRHSITKMANLHFTGNEEMRKRVIQLGEQPETVYNVGEPGVENVLQTPLMSFAELKSSLNFESLKENNYYVVTYHPETITDIMPIEQIKLVLDVILKHNEYCYIITKSNIDKNGYEINQYIKEQTKGHKNILFIDSLGFKRYLSALKFSRGVVGNSSSGIVEAPYFKIPTINIGDRQQGRLQDCSIINATINKESIENAFKTANSLDFLNQCKQNKMLYGRGNTSELICNILKEFLDGNKLSKKKIFYDLEGLI